MILFEATNLGWDYMLLRFVCNIIGIIIIAILLEKMIPSEERKSIYANALNYNK